MFHPLCVSFVPMIQRCSFRQLCWLRIIVTRLISTWAVHRWSLREVNLSFIYEPMNFLRYHFLKIASERIVLPNLQTSERGTWHWCFSFLFSFLFFFKDTMEFFYKMNGTCWKKWVSLCLCDWRLLLDIMFSRIFMMQKHFSHIFCLFNQFNLRHLNFPLICQSA